MSDEIIDAKGREYTTAVRNELKGDLAALAARVRALETRPAPAGLSRDEIWKLAGDRIFAELTTSGTPLFAAVHQGGDVKAEVQAILSQIRIGLVLE